MKYSEKLKDPRWQKKRLEIFARDEFTCQRCFDSESTLAVHHFRYIHGREPWDYPNNKLITLCETCHSAEYETMKDECESLIEQLKDKGFFASDIGRIANGINKLSSTYPPEVMACMIEFILSSDEKTQSIWWDLYFADCKAIAERKRNNGTTTKA